MRHLHAGRRLPATGQKECSICCYTSPRMQPRSRQQRRQSERQLGAVCSAAASSEEGTPEVVQEEVLSGQKSPVSGFKRWLPGGGLVHVTAEVHPTTVVEPAAVVQEGARVGRKCRIGSGSVVGPGCIVGDKCRIGFQVALERCSVGSHCVLHHGCRIGGLGFVFWEDGDGGLQRAKEDQGFRAEVRDAVEVGSNAVVDRGSWRDTVVDKGCKLDALVHVGHDATLGRACILCAGASVGASSSLADGVVLGAGAAVRDHVAVAARARVAARSGVVASITAAGDYAGHPAVPAAAFKHQARRLARMLGCLSAARLPRPRASVAAAGAQVAAASAARQREGEPRADGAAPGA